MELHSTMFEDVRLWKSSGRTKVEFVKDKNYTVEKFEYWIKMYNKNAAEPSSAKQFKEIPIQEVFTEKLDSSKRMMEIELPTGIKITIYK